MRVKMSKQPPPAPTASVVGPCPTVIQIVGRPGTGIYICCQGPSLIGIQKYEYEKGAHKIHLSSKKYVYVFISYY